MKLKSRKWDTYAVTLDAKGAHLCEEMLQMGVGKRSPRPIIDIGGQPHIYNGDYYEKLSVGELCYKLREVYAGERDFHKFISPTFLDRFALTQLQTIQGVNYGDYGGIEIPRGSILFNDGLGTFNRQTGEIDMEGKTSPKKSSVVRVPYEMEQLLDRAASPKGGDWSSFMKHHFEGRSWEETCFAWYCLYCYFDSPTDHIQQFLCIEGGGGTGKTTVLEAIFHALKECDQVAEFGLTSEFTSDKFKKSVIGQVRLLLFGDTDLRDPLFHMFKTIAAKEPFRADEKHKTARDYATTAQIVMCTNDMTMREKLAGDEGTSRRALVMTLDRAVGVEDRDIHLASKLKSEAGQLDIWAWLVFNFLLFEEEMRRTGKNHWQLLPDCWKVEKETVEFSNSMAATVSRYKNWTPTRTDDNLVELEITAAKLKTCVHGDHDVALTTSQHDEWMRWSNGKRVDEMRKIGFTVINATTKAGKTHKSNKSVIVWESGNPPNKHVGDWSK